MASYRESDLHFSFPAHWGVRRYDRHNYYRGLSGLGFKGVDFLAILPDDGQLLFLEVKNYLTRQTEDGVFVATPRPPEELAATIRRKYMDTRRALRAIYGFYRRKWWYRQLESRLRRRQNYQMDRVFWTQAYYLAEGIDQAIVVLWLETEARETAYRQAVARALEEELGAMVTVVVASREAPFPGIEAN